MEDANPQVGQETVLCPGCAPKRWRSTARSARRSAARTAIPSLCWKASFSPTKTQEDVAARAELERRDQEELDGRRIRQLAAERRAAFRQRSYAIVGLSGCYIFTIQLAWKTFDYVTRFGWHLQPVGFIPLRNRVPALGYLANADRAAANARVASAPPLSRRRRRASSLISRNYVTGPSAAAN